MYEHSFLEPIGYTPQEILARQSNNQRLESLTNIGNAGMGIGLNVAQNLGPLGSLGFLLGNLGGRAYNNYRERRDQEKIKAAQEQEKINAMSQSLGQYGQSLIPQAWQNQNQNNWYKAPENGEYFLNPSPASINQYDFSNYNQTPNLGWQNQNNPLLNFQR